MRRMNRTLCLAAVLASGLLVAGPAWTQGKAAPKAEGKSSAAKAAPAAKSSTAAAGKSEMSDSALIASASSAAPAAVAREATIVAAGADGQMRTIRQGSNGFTCMPDNPVTPGPDPMCMDANALEWGMAWMQHKPPPQKVGVMYMLAGGTDASNTDPFAEKPTAQNHWVKTGPHVMVVGNAEMLSQYPAKPDPDTSQPYVMWAGTPYAHLMMPVK